MDRFTRSARETPYDRPAAFTIEFRRSGLPGDQAADRRRGLRPGTQLNIDALARQLGVSNSPVREALRRLENERWVETIPFRGAFVRPFDQSELADLYELREMLEVVGPAKSDAPPAG